MHTLPFFVVEISLNFVSFLYGLMKTLLATLSVLLVLTFSNLPPKTLFLFSDHNTGQTEVTSNCKKFSTFFHCKQKIYILDEENKTNCIEQDPV
jgi:hypothetical protein